MKRLGWTLFYACVFCLLIYNSFSYLDPDYGWHLAFGRHIWLTGAVPHDQIYMWTIAGQTWVDHEWLSNLITFAVSSFSGYVGVTVFFALLPVAMLATANSYLFRSSSRPAERIALAVFEFAAIIAMLPHLGVRMQEWTILFFLLLLLIIEGVRRSRRWQSSLWLVPLLYAWSCLHGGFLIGIAITIGWIGYEWVLALFAKRFAWMHDQPLTVALLWKITVIAAIAIAATLATPYGPGLYAFLSDYTQTFYVTHIQEWRSPFTVPIRYWQLGVIIATVAGAIFCRLVSKEKLPAWNIAVGALLVIMSLKSVRHFPLFAVATLVLIAPAIIRSLSPAWSMELSKLNKTTATICLAMLSVLLAIGAKITDRPFESYCKNYPCEAARFLSEKAEYSSRLFNAYNWGGYLIGAAPDLRLFIDGRLPQYDFRGRTMLEEYVDFLSPTAEEKLSEHGIQNVLIETSPSMPKLDWFERVILGYRDDQFTPNTSLIDYLSESPDWSIVYEDAISRIYSRNNYAR